MKGWPSGVWSGHAGRCSAESGCKGLVDREALQNQGRWLEPPFSLEERDEGDTFHESISQEKEEM